MTVRLQNVGVFSRTVVAGRTMSAQSTVSVREEFVTATKILRGEAATHVVRVGATALLELYT